MNIKKQIILDDKDYERLVHDANLSNDEIKSKIASALTTDNVGISISDHGSILTVWMYMLW